MIILVNWSALFIDLEIILKVPLLKQVFILIYKLLMIVSRILSSSHIPASTTIGKSLRLEHGGNGVIIHPRATVGDNARIFQQVTIGLSAGESAPKIGKNVLIGAGAKIIDDITIGNNVIIGANAVVNKSLPDNCTAVGIPAKIIKQN